jgi:hypothetical protein
MLLMSEGLADRIILSNSDLEEDDAEASKDSVSELKDQKAVIQFTIGTEVIRCTLKKMILSTDSISTTFSTVPSLPMRLRENVPVRCTLICGSHLLDFDLNTFQVEWDNVEGKQLCTIINKIEQHARSSG